jgi:hypothetical protein
MQQSPACCQQLPYRMGAHVGKAVVVAHDVVVPDSVHRRVTLVPVCVAGLHRTVHDWPTAFGVQSCLGRAAPHRVL